MRDNLSDSQYNSYDYELLESQSLKEPKEFYRLLSEIENPIFCLLDMQNEERKKLLEKRPYLFNFNSMRYYEHYNYHSSKNIKVSKLLGIFDILKIETVKCYIVSSIDTNLFRRIYKIFKKEVPNVEFFYYECDEQMTTDDIQEITNLISEYLDETVEIYIDETVLPELYIRNPPMLEHDDS